MGLFSKKSLKEKEEEFENKIIENNLAVSNNNITAKVIKYSLKEDSDIPEIINLCDFHASALPTENSIIWIPENKILKPYKVVRYDFIQDPEEQINEYIYIVVKPAYLNDIAEIDTY